jgi:hypothetical protein
MKAWDVVTTMHHAFIDASGVHSIYAFSFIAFGQETADRTIPQRDTCTRAHLDRARKYSFLLMHVIHLGWLHQSRIF